MDGRTALAKALEALVEMTKDGGLRAELRLEAAKTIVNRPRPSGWSED